jgi:arsenate reductase (glutaredoxin)
MELWLNPACQKCRTAQAALDEAGVEYVVRRSLDDGPPPAELADVLGRLGLEPWDVARPQEAKEAGIDLPRSAEARERWLEALSQNPRAIQRPILTAADGTTVVGRDEASLATVIAAEQG